MRLARAAWSKTAVLARQTELSDGSQHVFLRKPLVKVGTAPDGDIGQDWSVSARTGLQWLKKANAMMGYGMQQATVPPQQAMATMNQFMRPEMMPVQQMMGLNAPGLAGQAGMSGQDLLPGSAAIKSTIQDIGPISTVGNITGNAGQGVKNAPTPSKLA